MKDTEDINIMNKIRKTKPKKILNICFFVITIPKEENLILNTLSCNDKASNIVYTLILFKQFGHE